MKNDMCRAVLWGQGSSIFFGPFQPCHVCRLRGICVVKFCFLFMTAACSYRGLWLLNPVWDNNWHWKRMELLQEAWKRPRLTATNSNYARTKVWTGFQKHLLFFWSPFLGIIYIVVMILWIFEHLKATGILWISEGWRPRIRSSSKLIPLNIFMSCSVVRWSLLSC